MTKVRKNLAGIQAAGVRTVYCTLGGPGSRHVRGGRAAPLRWCCLSRVSFHTRGGFGNYMAGMLENVGGRRRYLDTAYLSLALSLPALGCRARDAVLSRQSESVLKCTAERPNRPLPSSVCLSVRLADWLVITPLGHISLMGGSPLQLGQPSTDPLTD